ncbi:MAG TPA: transposase [Candidatus Kapabacteria bacterium]|nr:transposase [Candidatus Kapabacteria bacterium]
MLTDKFKQKYRISSARLQHYDYAKSGLYFITGNAFNHQCIFGDVVDSEMRNSALGEVAEACWTAIPSHFQHVELDCFQVMPNHLHGILQLVEDGAGAGTFDVMEGRKPGGLQRGSISSILNSFKGAVTKEAKRLGLAETVWQGRFHDHVIRNEQDLERIRHYIVNNPAQWTQDRYFVAKV